MYDQVFKDIETLAKFEGITWAANYDMQSMSMKIVCKYGDICTNFRIPIKNCSSGDIYAKFLEAFKLLKDASETQKLQ